MSAMKRSKELSGRQQEILDYLRQVIRDKGYVPSIREIAEAVGIHSTSTIHHHMTTLAERGHIRWEKGKNRAVQLLDAGVADVPRGDRPTVVTREPEVGARGLPLMGRIAAGQPIEAISDDQEHVDLGAMWHSDGNYLLQVKGESMIEDHIAPGDLVVVRSQTTARDGEIVVALVDGQEATLKRLYRERDRMRLQPANAMMEPIYVSPDRLQIQGKVVGVIRQVH